MVLELKPIEGPGVDCSMLSTQELDKRLRLIGKLCAAYVEINKIQSITSDDFETICKMDNHMLTEAYEHLLHAKMIIEMHEIIEKLRKESE
tara:strand:+ start:1068 stop:1340 length:273 start_codon:yes stop_codon:yes gene_type:complete